MSAILDRIIAGELPEHAREAVIKGLMPLESEDLIAAMAFLCGSDEGLIREARNTIGGLPDGVKKSFFENKGLDPNITEFYLRHMGLAIEIQMVMLLNPSTRGQSIAKVAPTLDAQLLDIVVNNQVKILEDPSICGALGQNPGLSINQKQRLEEYQRLLLKNQISPAEELESKSIEEIEAEAIEDAKNYVRVFGRETPSSSTRSSAHALEEADEPEHDESDLEMVALAPIAESGVKKEKISVLEQLAGMSVPQKVQAAIKGDREVRNILIRDSNKLVSSAVIKSPRITDAEVEFYSNLRNVATDILRMIAQNREWTKNYKVIFNLVKNPRTPIIHSTKFLPRLNKKDLKGLEKDKGVPEVIRVMARKMSREPSR